MVDIPGPEERRELLRKCGIGREPDPPSRQATVEGGSVVVVSGDHATIYIGAQETPQEAQERSRARIEELMRRLEALVQPGRLEDARAILEQHLGRDAA